MKRLFIIIMAVLGLGLSCNKTEPKQPYNILWLTAEDLSPLFACYGDSTVATPNIDRIAREGVRYTNAYSISGVCAPSRHALITGMYPISTGAMHMRTIKRTSALSKITDPELLAIPTYEAVPPPEAKCFSEYLRAEGYYCTNNVKTDYQFHLPITAWDDNSNVAHWRDRPAGMPFFSIFNFTVTHESQVWKRANLPLLVDPDVVPLPPYYPDTPVIRNDVARHYSNVVALDSLIGDKLAELEADGLLDKTIIFFYGDHGDGLPRGKRWLYDSGLRVPLIVRWPDGRDAGKVVDDLVSFVDFAPTMLSLTGIPVPDYMQGQPFLGEQKTPARKYIYAAKDRMDPALDTHRAIRDKRFKYIKNYQPEKPYVQFLPYRDQMPLMQELLRMDKAGELTGTPAIWFSKTKPVDEFYDTWNDPHEVNNLAGEPEYAETLAEMKVELAKWEKASNDLGHMPEPELIKVLWAPDGVQPVTGEPTIQPDNTEFTDRFEMTLSSETPGASLAYRFNDSERWLLYTEPVLITESTTLEATAIRIGYKPSTVVSRQFQKRN